MKDYYQTLGIKPDASVEQIKKAYRTLALDAHPDRGGDSERMGMLNEAYHALSDAEQRRNFDTDWRAYQDADVQTEPEVSIDGYLPAGNAHPYSHLFKIQHQGLVVQYTQSPLINSTDAPQAFESNLYRLKISGKPIRYYHDIFTFVRAKNRAFNPKNPSNFATSEPLTPAIAISWLTDFLAGNDYKRSALSAIQNHFALEIKRIKSTNRPSQDLLLYEGIVELILMTEEPSVMDWLSATACFNRHITWSDLSPKIMLVIMLAIFMACRLMIFQSVTKQITIPANQRNLMLAIQKITDFAKQAPTAVLPNIIALFYSQSFRNLYAYALHLQWHARENLFDVTHLSQFDGQQAAEELLTVLKERLSTSGGHRGLSELIQYIKLLYHFEKDQARSNAMQPSAASCREHAYHVLDWIPVFIEQSSRQILVNLFLQIGIKFQQASRLESRQAMKMADERMALKMYLTAVGIGHHATPDVEMYANTHGLNYILALQYQDAMTHEVIAALKKRTTTLTDVFPFFQSQQSNVAFLRQENQALHLMRQLLNAMLEAYEYNKTHPDSRPITHSAVTILYQVYEACLKNWYQEQYDPAIEQKFRLALMEELLFDNGWTSLDVEQRIDSPWVMVARDEQGFLKPTRLLPYSEDDCFVKYRTINGAEINHKTGEINFLMTPWTRERPGYEKVFTLFDLQEMLEKNISSAIFSLDPVDLDKPYHPFNLMRFAPSQLYESELLNTMLLTDYILKFLTTNQEVQGRYPFEQRPITSMIQHLPQYLRQIIEAFHQSQQSGALHRFWIEAEEIDMSVSDEGMQSDAMTRIGVGDLKMQVKKHRMERDMHGALKDVGNEDEGWPIYVLTTAQMAELNRKKRAIDGHAMIFIDRETKLFYWENHAILQAHVPTDYRETLIRLYQQPKDSTGKVLQHTKNMPLMYRVTTDMARQAGLASRYSAEFIFAHQFTIHYDEFAQYLPEFGRLKELSKLSALIRMLDGMRIQNKASMQALDAILQPVSKPVAPMTDVDRNHHQTYQKMIDSIVAQFKTWRGQFSTSAMQQKHRTTLENMKRKIGTLTFSKDSKEVNDACQRLHDQNLKANHYRVSSEQIWRNAVNPERGRIAQQLSESKQAQYRTQLFSTFSAALAPLRAYQIEPLIDAFIEGNLQPLADGLVDSEKPKVHLEIKKQCPNSSISDIQLALDDVDDAGVVKIATAEARRQLSEQREEKTRLETGFVQINLGTHEAPVDLTGKCLWVPASVRHEVQKDDTSGLTRYSFFVYGGVSIQPRINVVQGGNAPLGGNSVGGGAFNRNNVTKGHQDHHIASDKNSFTKNHELWKLSGVNVNSRVNKIHLPKTAEQHPTRTLHSGRHTNAYSENVAKEMQKVVLQGKDKGWTPSQYREATRTLLSNMKQELRAGNIALNKNHRPWAKT